MIGIAEVTDVKDCRMGATLPEVNHLWVTFNLLTFKQNMRTQATVFGPTPLNLFTHSTQQGERMESKYHV